ncbi:MAG: hypothetical protein OXI63_13825 [Candidatus Poribacteria bacterium]|nr:hypothetical protein [Candidatus Poribacteria bacterium]
MEWFKEWAKPAVVIVAIGLIANCQNQRFDTIDNQLKVIDERTFEMNTRLSRIEGKLDITVNVPNNESPPARIEK